MTPANEPSWADEIKQEFMMGTVQRFGGHVTAALLGQVTIAAAIDARAERREQVAGLEAAVPGEQVPPPGYRPAHPAWLLAGNVRRPTAG
jgi:hypothetical protein